MKVCPHCAEELPDEATVCPHCHKDPAVAPAWAAAKRAGAPPVGWWDDSEDAWEQDRVPDPMDDIPSRYESLEPAAAKEPEIPRIAWVALGFSLFGPGIVVGLVLGIPRPAFSVAVRQRPATKQRNDPERRPGSRVWALGPEVASASAIRES